MSHAFPASLFVLRIRGKWPALNKDPQFNLSLEIEKARVQRSENPSLMTALPVRRDKAALSSGCKPHPATAPAGSNRSSHGGNEVAEAFD